MAEKKSCFFRRSCRSSTCADSRRSSIVTFLPESFLNAATSAALVMVLKMDPPLKLNLDNSSKSMSFSFGVFFGRRVCHNCFLFLTKRFNSYLNVSSGCGNSITDLRVVNKERSILSKSLVIRMTIPANFSMRYNKDVRSNECWFVR